MTWRGTFFRFLPYLVKRQRLALSALPALILLGIVAELARPWPLKVVLDGILFGKLPGFVPGALRGADHTDLLLISCCATVIVIALVDAFATWARTLLAAGIGLKAVRRIRAELVDRIQALDLAEHRKRGSGDLLIRVIGDVALLREFLLEALLDLGKNGLVVLGTLSMMFWLDWRLTLAALAVVPPFLLALVLFAPGIKEAVRKQRKKEGVLATDVSEALGALPLVQSFCLERRTRERVDGMNRSSARAGMRTTRLEASFGRIAELLLALGMAVVLFLGARRALAGSLTPGDLVVFVTYLRGVYKPIRNMAGRSSRLLKATACAERVLEVFAVVPQVRDRAGAVDAPALSGRVEASGVAFRYGDGPPVLDDVNLELHPGEKVALVGRSGAGKTTLASMLTRFHDPTQGAIRFDGIDARDVTLASLRSQIGLVPQETVLLRGTIGENIAIARPDASRADVERAARQAGAEEFIARMPLGYDTEVSERGASLSGGQARRIALARVLLKDPPIVVLDEPLTGLDRESEQAVSRSLLAAVAHKTTLLIAHRFALLPEVDRIAVLDEGRIVECGSHAELLARGGLYARLFRERDVDDRVVLATAELDP